MNLSGNEMKVLKVIDRELAVTYGDLTLKAGDIQEEDLNNILHTLSEGDLTRVMDIRPGDRVFLITEAGARMAESPAA